MAEDGRQAQAALERLRMHPSVSPPELLGAREGKAAALAFSESYGGDRVAALVFGLLTMVNAAFEHKADFYILDSLNEMKLYNCARNMEVAIWKLANDRNGAGELYLLSNEGDQVRRNLSFEREFGREIGLLDLMASVVADRNGRALSRFSQSVATMIFLPVGGLPVRSVRRAPRSSPLVWRGRRGGGNGDGPARGHGSDGKGGLRQDPAQFFVEDAHVDRLGNVAIHSRLQAALAVSLQSVGGHRDDGGTVAASGFPRA